MKRGINLGIIIRNIFFFIATLYLIMGIICFLKVRKISRKVMVSSLIDTMATISCIFGIIFWKGVSMFSFKMVLILIFLMITVSLNNHLVAKAIYERNDIDEH